MLFQSGLRLLVFHFQCPPLCRLPVRQGLGSFLLPSGRTCQTPFQINRIGPVPFRLGEGVP